MHARGLRGSHGDGAIAPSERVLQSATVSLRTRTYSSAPSALSTRPQRIHLTDRPPAASPGYWHWPVL